MTLTVPDLVGVTVDEAREKLENLCDTPPCLSAQISAAPSGDVAEGIVISQDPAAGAQLAAGGTVALVVSEVPPTTTES